MRQLVRDDCAAILPFPVDAVAAVLANTAAHTIDNAIIADFLAAPPIPDAMVRMLLDTLPSPFREE